MNQTQIEELWKCHNDFATPISIDKDVDYRNALDNIMSQLELKFSEVHADNFYLDTIRVYRESLVGVIDLYYSGCINKAQDAVDKLLDDLWPEPIAVSNINNSFSFLTNNFEQEVQFFRARCNSKIVDYKREEMLHIPFSKRAMVQTQRFSIPGLPCLYLGTSSYVCWLELGRPADYMFNVSPIQLDNSQHILNLAVNFRDFLNEDVPEETRKAIFKLFLLSMATSFKVVENNRTFKSEYIVSQLLMLSCMERGLSGIAYYSKQVKNDNFAKSIGVNLVLFASYDNGDELSEICDHVSVSESFNYAMYKQLTIPLTFRKAKLRIDNIGIIQNIGSYERQYPYKETEFYQFDHYLYSYIPPTPFKRKSI